MILLFFCVILFYEVIQMVKRYQYLEKLKKLKDMQIIKVVTGFRRCGKSTLLLQFREYLKECSVDDSQIISINFEKLEYEHLLDYKALYSYITERLCTNKTTYIFLDEIQLVNGYQKAVDSLFVRDNVDIYITGSNAQMLSGELATLLSGRFIEIEMLPLSFAEFVAWTGDNGDLSGKYRRYLETSFPYATELDGDKKAIEEYLSGIYHTVVLKDVVGRLKNADPMMLESILRFVYSSTGSPISTKKIADTMASDGRKLDVRTVEKYLTAFVDSYIVYQAQRYDIRGRQYLKTLEKYYAVDIGLRYFLLGGRYADTGHILENVIYLELRRRGYDVFVGKLDELEVDFVAVNQAGTLYVQVAATVRDENTLARELRPLQKIRDSYAKLILTLDDDPPADYEGIRRINALEWLIGEQG